MRVVAGLAKGRPLTPPPGRATRPTSDKVREAMFSMITSMDLLDGAAVADLFAGSGALGIEALSRGAAKVTFVESDPVAIGAIRANLDGFPERRDDGVVVRSEVTRYLRDDVSFDLVLADPPYRYENWTELFGLLVAKAVTVIAESDHPLEPGPAWETVKVRKYGGTVVTVAQPAAHSNVVRIEGEI